MDTLSKCVEAYRKAADLGERQVAVEAIARFMWPKLHRYISAFCPRHAVEDVVQNSLLSIVTHLPEFEGDAQFENWCFRIAHHRLVDYFRVEHRTKIESLDREEIWRIVEASEQTTSMTAEQRETLAEALELIALAKPPCAKALNLRFIAGLSFDELGRAFGKSADAARVQVRRCLELAQQLLSKKGATHV